MYVYVAIYKSSGYVNVQNRVKGSVASARQMLQLVSWR